MQLNRKGIALVVVLMTIATIGGLAAIVFNRMVFELKHSAMDAGTVQSLMLARGGANVGTGILDGATFRSQLQASVRKYAKSSEAWSFGGNTTTTDPQKVATSLSLVGGDLQTKADTLFCSLSPAPTGSGGSVQVRIYFTTTACGKNLPSKVPLPKGRLIEGAARSKANPSATQIYALPFVMVSDSSQGAYKRNLVVQGEYRIRIGTSSFAYYAYLTNRRKSGLYFSSSDMVDGPVHSNQYLRFNGNPWFGREVTVAGCTNPYPDTSQCGPKATGDFFAGVNSNNLVDSTTITANNACWGSTCPTFANGREFNADFIPLPNQNNEQRARAIENGLYFNQSLKSLTLFAGDLDKKPLVKSGSNWVLESGITTYQYIKACPPSGSCDFYRYNSSDNLLFREEGGSWVQQLDSDGYPKAFNGVVFADGGIEELEGPKRSANASDPNTASPALASFAQITVAADDAIRVTGDLKYQDVPCESFPAKDNNGNVTAGSCSNKAAQNILGVYSLQGEVTFGTGDNHTLTDLTLHGVFMSGQNRVGVTNCFSVSDPNSCTSGWGNELRIMGGLIGETVSGFASSGTNGYSRRIKYDERLLDGLSPPFFPTTSQEQVSAPIMLYGQREQVQ